MARVSVRWYVRPQEKLVWFYALLDAYTKKIATNLEKKMDF